MQQKINAGARAKVIAATATIEEYENQISHLYNRKANRFPSPGYELRSNFYAVDLDEISRIFVGIMPHGVVQLSATKAILAAFHELIQNMKINPQYYIGVIGLETTQAEFEDNTTLRVSLTYVNSGTMLVLSVDSSTKIDRIRSKGSVHLARLV